MKRCQKWPSEWHSGKVGKAGAKRSRSWEAACRPSKHCFILLYSRASICYWLIFKCIHRGKPTSEGSLQFYNYSQGLEFPMLPQGHDLFPHNSGLWRYRLVDITTHHKRWSSWLMTLINIWPQLSRWPRPSQRNRSHVQSWRLCYWLLPVPDNVSRRVSLHSDRRVFTQMWGNTILHWAYCPFKNKSSPSRPLTRLWRLNARVCLLLAPDSQIAIVPTPLTFFFLSMKDTSILITIFFYLYVNRIFRVESTDWISATTAAHHSDWYLHLRK